MEKEILEFDTPRIVEQLKRKYSKSFSGVVTLKKDIPLDGQKVKALKAGTLGVVTGYEGDTLKVVFVANNEEITVEVNKDTVAPADPTEKIAY